MRTLLAVVSITLSGVCLADIALGQQSLQPKDVRPGAVVEVQFGTQWREAKIVGVTRTGIITVEFELDGRTQKRTTSFNRLRAVGSTPPMPAVPAAKPELRTWTDATGKFSIDANFVEQKDGDVVLRTADGKTLTVPLDKLSETDQEFLEVWSKTASATPSPDPTYEVGQKVEVDYRGKWYAATIKEARDGKYFIGYEGYSSNFDEWVTTERLRQVAGTTPAQPSQPAGSSVANDGAFSGRPTIAELDFMSAPVLAISELTMPSAVLVDGANMAPWPAGSTAIAQRTLHAKGGRLSRLLAAEPLAIASWFDTKDRTTWGTFIARLEPGKSQPTQLAFLPAQLEIFPGREDGLLALHASRGNTFKPDTLYQLKWSADGALQPTGASAKLVNLPPLGAELVWTGQGVDGAIALLTSDGSVLLLDSALKPRLRIEGPASASPSIPAFSPGGKYLAIRMDRYVSLVDLQAGKVAAAWAPNLQQPQFAFSPNGKLLACSDSSEFAVFDLTSGRETVRLAAPQLQGFTQSSPVWLGNDKLLVNQQLLVDAARGIPLWLYDTTYSRPLVVTSLGSSAGYFFAASTLGMLALELPHSAAEATLNSVDPGKMFAVQPGGSVALKLVNQSGGAVDDSKVLQAMQRAMAAAGWKSDPSAAVQLQVTIEQGQQQTATFGPQPGVSGASERVSYTPLETTVAVVINGKTVWSRGDTGAMPATIFTRAGESAQAAISRWKNVNQGFLESVQLPQRIVTPEFAMGLGRSQATATGVQNAP